jgi:hypothetical protein
MAQKLRLHLSVIIIFLSLEGSAQLLSVRNFSLLPGMTINPVALTRGYSAATSYSLQFGARGFPLKGVVRFGFPNYNKDGEGSTRWNYKISGSYIEPGLIIYSKDISEAKSTFYVGLLGYFASYDHKLNLKIEEGWGTQIFNYTAKTKVNGILVEFGGLFTFYNKVKGTLSMNIGGVNRPENPITQVRNFSNVYSLIPGIGHGFDKLLFGFNLGVHYEVN